MSYRAGVQTATGGGWIAVLKDGGARISMDGNGHHWMGA
jgi:hypothetical protein